MKRTVVSFIAGVLVAIGASVAYAEVSSMIGKKIDGQFPLKVNGEFSEVPAITVEGRSYIPLRAAGELFGAQVAWLDGEIIMEYEDRNQDRPTETPEDLAERARIEQEEFDRRAAEEAERIRAKSVRDAKITEYKVQIMNKQRDIDLKKAEIQEIEARIKENPEYISVEGPVRYKDTPQYQRDLERTAQLKSEIEAIQNEIDALEAELAELDRQKAELEAQQ